MADLNRLEKGKKRRNTRALLDFGHSAETAKRNKVHCSK